VFHFAASRLAPVNSSPKTCFHVAAKTEVPELTEGCSGGEDGVVGRLGSGLAEVDVGKGDGNDGSDGPEVGTQGQAAAEPAAALGVDVAAAPVNGRGTAVPEPVPRGVRPSPVATPSALDAAAEDSPPGVVGVVVAAAGVALGTPPSEVAEPNAAVAWLGATEAATTGTTTRQAMPVSATT
jgi:hypothetical protein